MMIENPLHPANVFTRLLKHFGKQSWWPAETPFEVMVGAVLTQNTAWINVEKAIANLRAHDCLTLEALQACESAQLAQMIRPSGFLHIKAKRLLALCRWLRSMGGITALGLIETEQLRQQLLAVHGIGQETADAILLYALNRPVFVVDAYTRRLFSRLGLVAGDVNYTELQDFFVAKLERDAALFNEYHALIVALGKHHCRPKPICAACPLELICQFKP
jgi:endonuclease-3 related protein